MQLGEKKGRFVHKLKVANRSFSVAESSPGASVSAAPKRAVFRTGGIPKGGSPWRAFGDFPRDGKVTRGGGAERPLMGVWGPPAPTSGREEPSLTTCSRGAAPLASVAAGATSPAQTPGTWSAAPTNRGYAGPPAPAPSPSAVERFPPDTKKTIFIHKFMLYCFCQKSYSPQFR